MIDLHLHLDGSLSIEDFLYLSKKDDIDLGSDFPNNIYVNNDCSSLEEYLERFSLPLKLLQTKENLSYVVSSLVDRLYNLGYIYAEIRFAPLLHLEKGLTQKQLADALKINSVTYLHYEKDQREPPLSLLADMAKFFGVSVDYLLGLTDY